MHSVVVDELLCCECIEVVHKFLLVKQEGLQLIAEGATVGHTVLVQFIQLSDYCKKKQPKKRINTGTFLLSLTVNKYTQIHTIFLPKWLCSYNRSFKNDFSFL